MSLVSILCLVLLFFITLHINKRFDGVEKRLDDVEIEIKKLRVTVDGEIKTIIGSFKFNNK
ncbi:hypothetical protein [Clostridium estertheticum]|uniref:hypothetical protein n=1 Tax=Clostridium estertheticum TaxID=238834 RepID=UPI001CF3559E|nr:hypothetical protein [Clostridium estertheticum]MCB2340767.1 hypothetical protein [Clostridium estertheticum]